jgi:asparagine synthase (glutamine-hydrolysing)
MCGIVGQVTDRARSAEPLLLNRMCAALEHRGPDARGLHAEGRVGLGIQRLRVIDLEHGDQPIYNEDRSVVVVLNGEIYNYRELRAELKRKGHEFRTDGDTEAIVHLYEEQGPDCVRSLHGMFAFALWDAPRGQLLLARDRVGKKPLFYSLRGQTISFASELVALMQDEDIPREVDHQAIDCFLSYQYVPSPLSAFRAVRKLPPASTMVFRDGEARIERYWRLDYSRKRDVGDRAELLEELREHIRRAVRRRLIADVPLGAFLSGGVDSSAVVAAMAHESAGPVKTFSIGFENESFNEVEYARAVAQQYGTDHHEFIVRPEAIEMVPKLVRHYGEPFADSSAIPSFYLAELARRHVTVALNGDGGDESFAGYGRYLGHPLARRLEGMPGPARRAVVEIGRRLPKTQRERSFSARARRLADSLSLEPWQRYARDMSFFNWVERDDLYTDAYKDAIGESLAPDVIRGPWEEASGADRTDILLEVDVETYLPGDLLVKIDIATMAHSLESRSPFLDHELMEFAASLPPELKLDGMEKKAILRDALRQWLPGDLLDRPKMGFGVPIVDWFRTDLRSYVQEILLDRESRDRDYFDEGYVRGLIDRHIAAVEDNSPKIWALLMLEMWHRMFIDEPVALAAVA